MFTGGVQFKYWYFLKIYSELRGSVIYYTVGGTALWVMSSVWVNPKVTGWHDGAQMVVVKAVREYWVTEYEYVNEVRMRTLFTLWFSSVDTWTS